MKMNIISCVLSFLIYYNHVAGRCSPERRVIGGIISNITDLPWSVSLLHNGNFGYLHYCGGSIITSNAILSAAHCFISKTGEPQDASLWVARIGSSYSQHGGSLLRVTRFHLANYIAKTRENDLAVVQTLKNFRFVPGSVAPAILATAEKVVHENMSLIAIGWGKTGPTDSFSRQLRHVHLKSMSNDRCNELYESILQTRQPVHLNMICARHKYAGGTCTGDSGSPLLYQGILVGVTSWSGPFCNSTLPSVFTRVSPYYTWIQKIITEIKK